MQLKFSIITVTFNAERWLERTIQSVIRQPAGFMEHIIIDGGSTDGTLDIIKKYQDKIAYWISEPDEGLYDAMNKGLQKATGDYVWFINAGDIIHASDTVANIVKGIGGPELPDVIYGETAVSDKNGNVVGMRRLKTPEDLNWKSFRWGMSVCHQSFIARKKIVPLYNLSYHIAADYDWCIRCLKSARVIHNTNIVLSDFLEEGLSSRRRNEALKERYRIMCRYYGRIPTIFFHMWFLVRFYFAKWVKGRV